MKQIAVYFVVLLVVLTPLLSTSVVAQSDGISISVSGQVSGIAYADNTIYSITNGGTLRAHNASTGTLKWESETIFSNVDGLHYSPQSDRLYILGSFEEFTIKGALTIHTVRMYTPTGSYIDERRNIRHQIAIDRTAGNYVLGGEGSGSGSVNLSTYDTGLNRISGTQFTTSQATVAINEETGIGVVYRNDETHLYDYSTWDLQRTIQDSGALNHDLWAINDNVVFTQSGMYDIQSGTNYFTYSNAQAVAIHQTQNTGYVLNEGSIRAFDESGNVIDTLTIPHNTPDRKSINLKTIQRNGETKLLYGNGQYIGIVSAPISTSQPTATPTETPQTTDSTGPTTGSRETLTTDIAFVFGACIIGSLLTALYLRSVFGMYGVLLMVVALIGSFLTGLPLLWFWLATLLEIIILGIGSIVYTRAGTRTKN